MAAMPRRTVVIDTQSLLDWLHFRSPACEQWSARLRADWMWVFTSDMRREFEHVRSRGFGPRWPDRGLAEPDPWHMLGRDLPAPALRGPSALRCTDPDDQKFIDLAVSQAPCHLVTRDKALLRLARAMRDRHGVQVCVADAWNAVAIAAREAPGPAPRGA